MKGTNERDDEENRTNCQSLPPWYLSDLWRKILCKIWKHGKKTVSLISVIKLGCVFFGAAQCYKCYTRIQKLAKNTLNQKHLHNVYIYIIYFILVGGLEHFSHSVGKNHPNWRTHIFQRGRYTTNQGLFGHAMIRPTTMEWCERGQLSREELNQKHHRYQQDVELQDIYNRYIQYHV